MRKVILVQSCIPINHSVYYSNQFESFLRKFNRLHRVNHSQHSLAAFTLLNEHVATLNRCLEKMVLKWLFLNNQAPTYIRDLIVSYVPNRVPHSHTAGLPKVVPKIWLSASSPVEPALVLVCEADTQSNFKTRFKTFLFDKSYS